MNIAIVVVSDRAFAGIYEDATGPAISRYLANAGLNAHHTNIVPDDHDLIVTELEAWCDDPIVDIVLTAGGTGISPRDVTPEATATVIDRVIPGIAEAMRAAGRASTPLADLSRATAGHRAKTLIVNLPGSPRGAIESLDAVVALLRHAVEVLGRPS